MKTLTLELPAQAAAKYEELEQKHGEDIKRLLEKVILRTLENIDSSTELDLKTLETKLTLSEDDEREFRELASYIVEKNAELYRRLA
ncbi:MAG TPA: hypothetical protein VJ810_11830 [Blastocatellia bacterium]|nr:hypothetical protein [Blastocatellia bacterium]